MLFPCFPKEIFDFRLYFQQYNINLLQECWFPLGLFLPSVKATVTVSVHVYMFVSGDLTILCLLLLFSFINKISLFLLLLLLLYTLHV